MKTKYAQNSFVLTNQSVKKENHTPKLKPVMVKFVGNNDSKSGLYCQAYVDPSIKELNSWQPMKQTLFQAINQVTGEKALVKYHNQQSSWVPPKHRFVSDSDAWIVTEKISDDFEEYIAKDVLLLWERIDLQGA